MFKSNKSAILFTALFLMSGNIFQGCGREDLRYTHFSGERSDLTVLLSEEVLFLYPGGEYDADSLAMLLETYDKAYRLAVELSGREPLPAPQKTDKLPLAIVPKTCGPGCGRLGQKGIEITKPTFDRIYTGFVVNGRHDHLFFYELGRNFWFYGDGEEKSDWEEIHTGFAVFFRDLLVKEFKLNIAPINGIPYAKYMEDKQSRFESFLAKMGTDSLNWEKVERIKKQQFPHSPLFWSSLWWELYQKQGREGVIAAFSLLKVQPLPENGEAWFRFLVKSGNLIAANEI